MIMKMIMTMFAMLFTLAMNAQYFDQVELLNPKDRRVVEGPFRGFFKPVPNNLTNFKVGYRVETQDIWLFRPTAQVTAMQVTYNKESSSLEVASLNQAGIGLSYQHFVDANGLPYNNLSLNALLLFDLNPVGVAPLGIAVAGTVSALQYINAGVGYNITHKKPFFLTGLMINFN